MSLNITDLIDAVASHAGTTGYFGQVNKHEPKSSPKGQLTAAVWVQDMVPVQSSGLASTSARITFNVRIYTPMLTEPQDMIDTTVMNAVDALLADYIGNFTLAGIIRYVDVRGIDGNPLRVESGYQSQDGKIYRVVTIFLPVTVNDLYIESP